MTALDIGDNVELIGDARHKYGKRGTIIGVDTMTGGIKLADDGVNWDPHDTIKDYQTDSSAWDDMVGQGDEGAEPPVVELAEAPKDADEDIAQLDALEHHLQALSQHNDSLVRYHGRCALKIVWKLRYGDEEGPE